jgi:hypothetical protein
MQAYRSRMVSAGESLDATAMPTDWRDNSRRILENNIAFMDDCLAKGSISLAALEAFAKKQGPLLKGNIAWAAQTQVAHWMSARTTSCSACLRSISDRRPSTTG